MQNYLLPRLQNILNSLNNDFMLIARKNKDDEWKRDHYRYAFTLAAQHMYDLLNSKLVDKQVTPVSHSTKLEMIILRDKLNEMITESV